MPKNKQLPPFWTRPAVEAHLKETIERYGTKVVLGEPAWMQMAHEVHRLCPTDARPTPDFARQSGTNSVPEWQTPPERGSFIEEDFEFREGRPCLVDSAAVPVQQDLNGLGPENGDISPGNSGEQRHSTPLIRKAVLGIFEVDFEVDDLPEWAAADQRRAHLCQFAYALRAFDYLMHKTFGPDYMKGVDLGESPAILRAMFEAFKGLDFTSDDAIAEDLLTIGNVGLPRHGSELQRSQPPHRLADCGISVIVELTDAIQRQLSEEPLDVSSAAMCSFFFEMSGAATTLSCNGRPPLRLRGKESWMMQALLQVGAAEEYFMTYKNILDALPTRKKKPNTRALRDPLEHLRSLKYSLNKKLGAHFNIKSEVLVTRPGEGLALNRVNFRWRRAPNMQSRKDSSVRQTAIARGGKASGLIEHGDDSVLLALDRLEPDDRATALDVMIRAGQAFIDNDLGLGSNANARVQ